MLNNKNDVHLSLRRLGLTADESKVYTCLLERPMSHLETSRKSGVNRTKVYRIADSLVKRGLVTEETSDRGKELAAADPANLEISLTTDEERIKLQRAVLQNALPELKQLYASSTARSPDDFTVNTYEGVAGFKQMLWNELQTKGEALVFGSGTLEDLVGSSRWSEKHRLKTIEAGYSIREVLNPNGKPDVFTKNNEFLGKYERRSLPASNLPLHHQICIYNDTVAIYNWRNDQKVGTEIVNKQYADMQRAVFEHYWRIAR